MRFVHFWGPVETRQSAIELILTALYRDERDPRKPAPQGTECCLVLVVPADKLPFVYGEEGSLLVKLYNDFGLWVDIEMDFVDGQECGIVLLKGTIESVPLGTWDILRALEGPPPK